MSWEAIYVLRNKLLQAGVRVVQKDCSQRGLQGLYHPSSDTLVVCRSHRSPDQVWDTLAHEATHRMQRCAGGPISNQKHHRAMYSALARSHPAEVRSIRVYPRQHQLAELEARFTAKRRFGDGNRDGYNAFSWSLWTERSTQLETAEVWFAKFRTAPS